MQIFVNQEDVLTFSDCKLLRLGLRIIIILFSFFLGKSVIACDGFVTGSDTICFSGASGYPITFHGTGGTGPYTFTYSINGVPQSTVVSGAGDSIQVIFPVSGLGQFDYTLFQVTDAAGCTVTVNSTATVQVVINPAIMITGSTTVYQNSTPLPVVTFAASGGLTPYTFNYTINGGPVQTITTAAGSSTATITIPTNVIGTYVIDLLSGTSPFPCPSIPNPIQNVVTVNVIPVPCTNPTGTATISGYCGVSTVTLTASGGTAPYTYTYSINGIPYTVTGGSPMSTFGPANWGFGPTTYAITGGTVSSNGCTGTLSAGNSVSIFPLAIISASVNTTSVCQNGISPIIHVSNSAATGGYYNYTVNGVPSTTGYSSYGAVDVNVPTAVAGTYTYTFSAFGCFSGNPSVTVVVKPLPGATITGTTSVCLNSASPNVTLTGTGATAPYTLTYNLNGGANQSVGVSPSTTIPVSTATAGTYTYSLVSAASANGCSQNVSSSAIVTVKPIPTATISGTNTVCAGSAMPQITFTGANGTAPYIFTYKINGGANLTVNSGASSSVTVNVPTGTAGSFVYTLVSVGSSGCSQNQSGSATVIVNALPTATISGNAAICQNSGNPTVTFSGSGGTAPYTFTYNINGGANQTVTSVASLITISAPSNVAGTFNYNLVNVSSSNGCSQNQSAAAAIMITPMPTATISANNSVCQGSGTTPVTFTGSNGASFPYSFFYSVNGGGTQSISTSLSSNTATINVPTTTAGSITYNIISVTNSGCLQAQPGSVTIAINPVPTATISGGTAVCQNDPQPVITFTGSNGTAPYVFTYNLGGGPNQTVSSGSGNTATISAPTGATGTFFYNLSSVSSANGCSQNQFGSAVITVGQLPTATISGGAAVCQNSGNTPVVFTGANGFGSYSFTYTLNGGPPQIILSGGGSTATINQSNTTAGSYVYQLISVSSTGCSQTQPGSVTVEVGLMPTAVISGTASVCQNEPEPVVTFTGSNGTVPYTFTYTLNGGANQTISTVSGNSVTLSVPTTIAGTFNYSLVSVSSGGCSQNQTGSASVIVKPTPSATLSSDLAACENQSTPFVFSGINGGTPFVFTYSVNSGPIQSITGNSANLVTAYIYANPAGTMEFNLISVTNQQGCSAIVDLIAQVQVNPQPTVSGDSLICEATTAQWIGSGIPNSANPWVSSNTSVATIDNSGLINAISSGTSMITYTNDLGCSVSETINVLAAPTASVSANSMICSGEEASFTISGTPGSTVDYTDGTSIYNLVIPASGDTLITVGELSASISFNLLSVQGPTPASCSTTLSETVSITVNPVPVADPLQDLLFCPGELSTVPSFSGTPSGISFDWVNSNTSIGLGSDGTGNISDFTVLNNQSNPIAATVDVTPLLNGCTGETVSFIIVVSNLPLASAGSDQTACQNDGSSYAIGSVAEAGNTYQWSPSVGLDNPAIANPSILNVSLPGTEYIVTVTNSLGCENSDTVLLEIVPSPIVTLNASDLAACQSAMISFDLEASNDLSVEWFIDGISIGNNDELYLTTNFGSSGIHAVSVVATNGYGCSVTEGIDGGIQIYPDVDAQFTTAQNMEDIDEFTGQLDLINQSENASGYVWIYNGNSFSTETDPTLVFNPGYGLIDIVLVATNEIGCVDTAELKLIPNTDGSIYVPNTFTPNGDGVNDWFFPVVSENFDLTACRLEIYNRWGELIFESDETTIAWNGFYLGELCKTDMYVWKLRVNTQESGFAKSIEGHVNLLR